MRVLQSGRGMGWNGCQEEEEEEEVKCQESVASVLAITVYCASSIALILNNI